MRRRRRPAPPGPCPCACARHDRRWSQSRRSPARGAAGHKGRNRSGWQRPRRWRRCRTDRRLRASARRPSDDASKCRLPGLPKGVQRDADVRSYLEILATDHTDRLQWNVMLGHQFLQLGNAARHDTDNDSSLRLTEIGGLATDRPGDTGATEPAATVEGAFRQRDQQASIGNIVGAAYHPSADGIEHRRLQTTLRLETHYWWPAFERRAEESQILTTGELLVRLAQEEDDIAIVLEPSRAPKGQVVEQADHPDHGSRWDVPFTGLVVEADVAAHDGQLEGAAGIGEAADALLQLAEDLRPLRITEVQAVGDRDRPGPGADDVAGCLRHRGPGAFVRVQRDVARVAVGGQRQALVGRGHPEQGGVETWADHRVVLHLVIVGAIDGAAAS